MQYASQGLVHKPGKPKVSAARTESTFWWSQCSESPGRYSALSPCIFWLQSTPPDQMILLFDFLGSALASLVGHCSKTGATIRKLDLSQMMPLNLEGHLDPLPHVGQHNHGHIPRCTGHQLIVDTQQAQALAACAILITSTKAARLSGWPGE